MTRNPSLAGKPSAVAGDPKKRTGIILAANYEARSYGVKTAMVLHEALKLCPGMMLAKLFAESPAACRGEFHWK